MHATARQTFLNGEGDSDGTLVCIGDPFAPTLLAAAPNLSGVASTSTLSEWGLTLRSLTAAAMAMVSVRRRL